MRLAWIKRDRITEPARLTDRFTRPSANKKYLEKHEACGTFRRLHLRLFVHCSAADVWLTNGHSYSRMKAENLRQKRIPEQEEGKEAKA